MRRYLVDAAGVPDETCAGVITRDERRRLLHVTKGHRLRVNGTQGWDRAEVTRGGICLDEVDPRTMESKKAPGLYIVGEVLDVDGPIGGFNFQAAFATGVLAGETAGGA
jgi:predicted flavoprotein YhiN